MFTLLVVIIGLIAIIMILVVLLQSGKGGGLAGIAAGGATQSLLGTRTAPDILEKATWVLGALFIFLCVVTTFFIGGEEGSQSVIQQGDATGQAAPVLPPVDAQSLPAANDAGAAATDTPDE